MLGSAGRWLRHSPIHYRKIAGLDAGRREAAPPKKGREKPIDGTIATARLENFAASWVDGPPSLTRFVRTTSTVVIEPADAPRLLEEYHPFILAMWHGQFSLMPTLRELHGRGYRVSAIACQA